MVAAIAPDGAPILLGLSTLAGGGNVRIDQHPEGQMNDELINALEALLAAAPDADSLRVLVGQATANKGPMSAEEFIAFARELLDAARKADQTA